MWVSFCFSKDSDWFVRVVLVGISVIVGLGFFWIVGLVFVGFCSLEIKWLVCEMWLVSSELIGFI